MQIKLFKAHILPILNYCSSIWHPKHIGSKLEIESIQRSFTKLLVTDNEISYLDRLQLFNLQPIIVQHTLTDIKNVYKVLKNYKFSHIFREVVKFILHSNLRRSTRTNHSLAITPMPRNPEISNLWLD